MFQRNLKIVSIAYLPPRIAELRGFSVCRARSDPEHDFCRYRTTRSVTSPTNFSAFSYDLYHPDIVTLANKAARVGVRVEMHVRNGLQHSYLLLPTPEGREARGIIARAVTSFAIRADREIATAGSGKPSLGAD
jgi:acetyl esterase/lipase